jgi:hypothetical protein
MTASWLNFECFEYEMNESHTLSHEKYSAALLISIGELMDWIQLSEIT